jgi:hypothetical protein
MFDNAAGVHTPLQGEASIGVPQGSAEESAYLSVEIRRNDLPRGMRVYLRKAASGWDVVGIER